MLESILFRNSGRAEHIIDIGALAESLIFYGKVRILADAGVISYLVKKIPPLILLELIEKGRIEFYYSSDSLAVRTDTTRQGEVHQLARIELANVAFEDQAVRLFREAASSAQGRLAGYRFGRLIKKFEHDSFNQTSVIQSLAASNSIAAAVESLIVNVAPGYEQAQGLEFKINLQDRSSFTIDTNIDFDKVNSLARSKSAIQTNLHPTALVIRLQDAYTSAFYAAAFDSEVSADAVQTAIELHVLSGVLTPAYTGRRNVGEFVELTLENTYAIREAVNSGRVTFYEVLSLLKSADRFRHWVASVPEDKELKSAYYKEVVKDSKFDKLPLKTTRWAGFTTAGLGIDLMATGGIATATALALGAADTFLLDKFLKGWKPNHFIEGDFKKIFHDKGVSK